MIFDLINFYLFPAMCIAYVAYIWLNTNAFYEYALKFKVFNVFPAVRKYKNKKGSLDFSTYMLTKQDQTFFEYLFSCHICLTFWMSFFYGVLSGLGVFGVLVVAFLSLSFYKVVSYE